MNFSQSANDHTVVPLILYEDDSIIVINKPAGMLAQDDSTGRLSLSRIVLNYLEEKSPTRDSIYLSALHRLDRPVSGAMLFAKSLTAARILSDDIRDRKIQKFYCAIVIPAPETTSSEDWNELNQYLLGRRDRAYIVGKNDQGAVSVSLRYRVMQSTVACGLILIELITGKRHQIRVQLASLGSPIAGDRFYGSGEITDGGIISLHAHYLCFTHPMTHNSMVISAPLPLHMTGRIETSPNLIDYLKD